MKQMSEFVTKLEGYADLEVSIIRATKINKVLKAILKLPNIPREDTFSFKARSQTLLDKWNKLLASETTFATPAASTNGAADTDGGDVKDTSAIVDNEAQEPSGDEKTEEPAPDDTADVVKETTEVSPEAQAEEKTVR